MDRIIGMILSTGMWCFQIGVLVLAGLAVWYVAAYFAGLVRPEGGAGCGWRRWGKAACILLVFFLTAALAANPPLIGDDDLEVPVKEMSDGLRQDCRTYSRGLYSLQLPLIPVYIEVLECDGEDALTRTHYFPLGTVEREVGLHGPNITKPLN